MKLPPVQRPTLQTPAQPRELGLANALKTQMNLLYIAVAVVVLALAYRFFVKK